MNKFEFKNLVKNLKNSLKEKTFFKDLRKEVNTGANGTQDYVVKNGGNSYKSLPNASPGCILFLIPSKPAINIAAKVRYGLPDASGNLISHLAPFLLNVIGIRHDADLFLAEYANNTGASNPGTNLL